MIKKIPVFLRSSEWWNTKLPLLLGLFLLFISLQQQPALAVMGHLAIVLVWVCAAAGFGYFLNDCFDIEVDRLAGKSNQAVKFKLWQRLLLLLVLGSIALGSVAVLENKLLFQLAAGHLLLFVLYSAPPLRLKNIPLAGILLDSLYAWVLPVVIVMQIAGAWQTTLLYASVTWALFAGVKSILKHHLADRHADKLSGTFNIAHRISIRTAVFLVQATFIAEVLAFVFLLRLVTPVWFFLLPLFLLFVVLRFVLLTRHGLRWNLKRRWQTGGMHVHPFYEDWMNVALISLFITRSAAFIPLGVLYLLLFRSDPLFKIVTRLFWAAYKFIYRSVMFIRYKVIYNSIMFLIYRVAYPSAMFLYYRVAYPWVMFLIYRVGFTTFILVRYKLYFAIRALVLWLPPFVYYRLLMPLYHHFLLRIAWGLFSIASLSVNYPIYYFRRIVLGKNDREARKMNEEEYRQYLIQKHTPEPVQAAVVAPVAMLIPEQVLVPAPVAQPQVIPAIVPATLPAEKQVLPPPPAMVFNNLPLTSDNKIVHGLWIGEQLSALEMLTIHSFTENGHEFFLWTYGPLKNTLPEGAVLMDANLIIPKEKIFRYKNKNKFGHGKGSVSGFSDIFRYKLLYEKGGWWVDMDVTCLKPLNLNAPYFFRQHHDLKLVGNVMKVPPHSNLMKKCYEESVTTIDENNTDWHKPIEILNKYVVEEDLQSYISGDISNEDKWKEIKIHICRAQKIPSQYYVIHWMNEEWRSRNMDKNDIRYNSALGKLMIYHGLLTLPDSPYQILLNDMRHLLYEFATQEY